MFGSQYCEEWASLEQSISPFNNPEMKGIGRISFSVVTCSLVWVAFWHTVKYEDDLAKKKKKQ